MNTFVESFDHPEVHSREYQSLFDTVNFQGSTRQAQEYDGHFSNLCQELLTLFDQSPEPLDIIGKVPQVMRSLIELRIRYPENNALDEAFAYGTRVVIAAYRQEFPEAKTSLLKCLRKLQESGVWENLPVKEKADAASWIACDPQYSNRTVQEMQKECGNTDVVFIPLANGGTRPGFDVFLRYLNATGGADSIILPVRYSRNKLGDDHPQLNATDLALIGRKVDQGLPIVIFEEDSNTAITREKALQYFQETFPQAHVVAVTNYDSLRDW